MVTNSLAIPSSRTSLTRVSKIVLIHAVVMKCIFHMNKSLALQDLKKLVPILFDHPGDLCWAWSEGMRDLQNKFATYSNKAP